MILRRLVGGMDVHRITGHVAAVQSPRAERGETRDIQPNRHLYGVELTKDFTIQRCGLNLLWGPCCADRTSRPGERRDLIGSAQ